MAAKLEFYNPASSVKDRIGVSMIDAAEASGELKPGGTIVEATSGNTGIALAMVGAARGYRVVLTMPESMSKERRALLRAYGAELVLTPAPEGMKGAVARAEQIGRDEGAVLVRQFANPPTPRSTAARRPRRSGTTPTARSTRSSPASAPAARSPASARCSSSASPTSRSSASSRPRARSSTAASPSGHPIQGIGANFVPEILDRTVYDEILDAPTDESVTYARRAAKEEGLLVGISSGAALWAATQVARRPEFDGKLIVVIVPSFGERYLSTILFQDLLD